MIKIHDKLWWVFGKTRQGNDRDGLCYMTYIENNKAFEKRKDTGLTWAKGYSYGRIEEADLKQEEDFNKPLEGFYIADVASRWSTSNKVFRVKDPRGFTVEVPSGNIATLLHECTVVNGYVQGECVWGRDGNSHILLPVGSEPYKQVFRDVETLNNLLSVKDLKVGDVFKVFEDQAEYQYLGFGYPIVEEKTTEYERGCFRKIKSQTIKTKKLDKKVHLYSRRSTGGVYIGKNIPKKIVEVTSNKPFDFIEISKEEHSYSYIGCSHLTVYGNVYTTIVGLDE